MDLNELHFAQPLWFWTLLIIPVIWGLYFLFCHTEEPIHQLEKLIDKHLIPHLLVKGSLQKKRLWIPLSFWSMVMGCFVIALAGPRWDFRELNTFTRDQSLVILLDLSESMNAQDVLPSRLARAKQKIEDILNLSKGVKLGLIAFAADPHMIVPMTEDKETVRHFLSSLDTSLISVQGSKLTPALEMAETMLTRESGSNKALVIVSDGGFEDASAIRQAKKLAANGIVIHTIGVGTLQGAALKSSTGALLKKNGQTFVSKLEKDKFAEISKIGLGTYFDAEHHTDLTPILEKLTNQSTHQESLQTQRFWEERFYLFLLPILPFFLMWYRRGFIIALLLAALMPQRCDASLGDYFYNQEQKAACAYAEHDYKTACEDFQDPYRKGVAYYRLGDYKTAEELFRSSVRPEVAVDAKYNLGNALSLQNKLKEAISAYEEVLEIDPEHDRARENLEIVKKMLEEQEKKEEEQEKNEEKEKKEKKEEEEQDKKDKKDKQDKQDQDQDKENKQDEEQDTQQEKDKQDEQDRQDQDQDQDRDRDRDQDRDQDKENKQDEAPQEEAPASEGKKGRSQEDLDADLWLNQIENDPKPFLKNKFYLESKKLGTKKEVDPW